MTPTQITDNLLAVIEVGPTGTMDLPQDHWVWPAAGALEDLSVTDWEAWLQAVDMDTLPAPLGIWYYTLGVLWSWITWHQWDAYLQAHGTALATLPESDRWLAPADTLRGKLQRVLDAHPQRPAFSAILGMYWDGMRITSADSTTPHSSGEVDEPAMTWLQYIVEDKGDYGTHMEALGDIIGTNKILDWVLVHAIWSMYKVQPGAVVRES